MAAGGDGAVVAGENHEGVGGEFQFIEQIEEAADVAVEARDHRGAGSARLLLRRVSLGAGKRFGLGPLAAIFGERILGHGDLGVRESERAEEEKRPIFVPADEIKGLAYEHILRIHGAAAVCVLGDLDAPAVFPKIIRVVRVGVALVDEAEKLVNALGRG